MNITIDKVPLKDKPILRNLMELYLHDFTEFDRADINDNGVYGYAYLDEYWIKNGRYPFFVRVDRKLAGFVLVHREEEINTIAEFFVMRKYRRQGIGSEVAKRIFDLFPGNWNVLQEACNAPAQAFWRKVIAEYTDGKFIERVWRSDEGKTGPMQEFRSPAMHVPGS